MRSPRALVLAFATGSHIGQNTITLAPPTSPLEWRYGDFAYRIFGH